VRVLVDSNVLLDVLEPDAAWYQWSAERIVQCATYGRLVVNHVVFAEVSVGLSSVETLDQKLPRSLYERAPLPWEAAFLAGKASWSTDAPAARDLPRYPTSTSARTRP
jgi:predicted nucleic acid-binding protein